MTEIENNNRTEHIFQNKQLKQLELLFEIYNLKSVREKLRKKLKSLEKMTKLDYNKNIANKIEAFKVISTENNDRFKEIMSKLKTSFNIFKLTKGLENNNQYLANLNKERKMGRIDVEDYEITRGYYLERIIDINENLNQLKDNAISYFQELKDELIILEDRRIKLTTEKLKKIITKEEFNQSISKIEALKQEFEKKLAFLKVEIIELELE